MPYVIEELKAQRCAIRMAMAFMMLVVYDGCLMLLCGQQAFRPEVKIAAASVTGVLALYIVYSAVQYTEMRLSLFEAYPMCPNVDMIMAEEDEEL